MNAFVLDVRYAWRVLAKSPLTSGIAILTLALGIGACAAIFSVINAALLTPPPGVADPGRIVTIGRTVDGSGFDNSSYPNYVDLRDQNRVFSDVAAAKSAAVSLGADGRAERRHAAVVTPNYFRALGVTFARGRGFDGADADRQAGPSIIVLSHAAWLQQFGGDPGLVGRTVTVNGQSCEVVGITAPGFRGVDATAPQDVWAPLWTAATLKMVPAFWLSALPFQTRDAVWIMLYARLKPGVTPAQARSDVSRVAEQLRAFPENARNGWTIDPGAGLRPGQRRELMRVTNLLFGAVGILLLLACVNVANLSLARAATRAREVSVRMAVGASRARLVRQLLTESALLAAAGGVGAVVVARIATAWISTLLADSVRLPLAMDLSPDALVVAFAFALAAATAVLFGLGPALQSSRTDLVPALKETMATAPRQSRVRRALVVVQLLLSTVLLLGAGLLLRTIRAFNAIDTGVNARNVVVATIDPSTTGRFDEPRLRQFYLQLLPRVQAIPGVERAALGRIAPVTPRGYGFSVTIPDHPGSFIERTGLQFNTVSTNYFDVMGIRVLRGRGFTDADTVTSLPVAVINEVAARRLWPGEDPIRKQIQVRGEALPRHVVGVVATIKYRNLIETPYPLAYYPLAQPVPMPEAPIVVHARTRLPVATFSAALAREVQALEPDLPVFNVKRLSDHMADAYWRQSLVGTFTAALALLALALGAIGMYGVMTFAAAARTREIGVRMALGATSGSVVRMFLWDAARLILAALTGGVALALLGGRLVTALLFGVNARDPLTFASVILILTAAGLIACAVPAVRASRVDPMVALRRE